MSSLPTSLQENDVVTYDAVLPGIHTLHAPPSKEAWGAADVVKSMEDCNCPSTTPILPVVPVPSNRSQRGNRQSALFEFTDPEAIKDKVRQANMPAGQRYDVRNSYRQEGRFQAVARHQWFENVTLGVIVINALWIWIDTDYNKDADTLFDAHPVFITADCLFFSYFVAELFIRFMAFQRKRNALKDGWFVFDSILVALYLFDPFLIAIAALMQGGGSLDLPTSILRLFRLARLTRLVRMLRSLPELMIMIKGMLSAAASVGYTLGLLLIITYVFAIAFTQLSEGSDFRELYFSSVPLAMYSLIIYGTFLDNLADWADAIREESTPCLMLATVFVALASMTVMNMLIGVLCEVISAVALEEKENMMIEKINEKFGQIVTRLDKNNSGTISWDEFQAILVMPEALAAFKSVDVDPVAMVDIAEDYFTDDNGLPICLSFDQFMELVLDSRGGQPATLQDISALRLRVNKNFLEVKEHMHCMDLKLDELLKLARHPSGSHDMASHPSGSQATKTCLVCEQVR